VSFTPLPLYSQGKSPRCPYFTRLGGPQCRYGRCGEFKKTCPVGNRIQARSSIDWGIPTSFFFFFYPRRWEISQNVWARIVLSAVEVQICLFWYLLRSSRIVFLQINTYSWVLLDKVTSGFEAVGTFVPCLSFWGSVPPACLMLVSSRSCEKPKPHTVIFYGEKTLGNSLPDFTMSYSRRQ
jgi:hypothetical protein